MSQVKAAILVGGPLDGKTMEIDVKQHGYLRAVYDLPRQAVFDFNPRPMKPNDRPPDYRTATYKEMSDGTHWKYYSG